MSNIPSDLTGLKDIYGVRFTGLIDKQAVYNKYRIPNPEAPYPQNFIIDKQGKVRFWEGEFDVQKSLDVIEELLDYKPPVTLEVVPDTLQLHPGDTLGYTVTFTNNTDMDQDFEGTLDEIRADSTRVTLRGPIPLHVPANGTVEMVLSELIPGGTPFGSYSFKIKIGPALGDPWEVDGFGFQVY